MEGFTFLTRENFVYTYSPIEGSERTDFFLRDYTDFFRREHVIHELERTF